MPIKTVIQYDKINSNPNDFIFTMDFEFIKSEGNVNQIPKPLSLGICSRELNNHLYVEFSEINKNEASDWVQKNVIKYLEGNAESLDTIKTKIIDFLRPYQNQNIYLLADSMVDLVIFNSLGIDTEINITLTLIQSYVASLFVDDLENPTNENKQETIFQIQNQAFKPLDNYDNYFKINKITQHHALNDSVALIEIYKDSWKHHFK